MSDLDKLFENAPEGAVEIKENVTSGYLRWFNKGRLAWYGYKWFKVEYEDYKTIATRPQPEQPRKTVEDAVEYYMEGKEIGRFNSNEANTLCFKRGGYHFAEAGSEMANCEYGWVVIGSREEFEAWVAAKANAKSGPEWTHTDGINKCKIIYTKGELSWIKCELGGDYVVHNDCLKPIKPTITKAEAWDKLGEDFAPSAMYMSIICAYEVTN